VTEPARDEFLSGIEERLAPIVVEIAGAIRAAAPELESRVSYGMLTYTLGKNRRAWVCAIGTTKKAVCLRFLYGTYLRDPGKLLRPGTSTLSTIDYTSLDQVDTKVVGEYVTEAAAHHAEFKVRAG
jgi:hypothetical protein